MEQIPVQDLQFRFIRKLRCFEPDSLKSTPYGRKLVAVSSQFGFVVAVGPNNGFISIKTSELHNLVSNDDSEYTGFPKRRFEFFLPTAEVFAIEFSCDGKVLAVAANTENGPFVFLFDGFTHSFEFNDQPFPLCSISLSSDPAAKLTAFEWNPCIPETFIVACTDKLSCFQFSLANPASFIVVGEKAFPSSITCLTWSPKGKQVTVGDLNGRIHQLKPELSIVRTTEAPLQGLSIGPGPYRTVGICWLETTEWLISYLSSTNNVCLLTLTIKKNQPPIWDEAKGFLPPVFQSGLSKSFHFWPLFDWQVVFAGSTCFTDVYAYGNVGSSWKPLSMDEIYSISTPLTRDGKQTQIVGGSFDFSSVIPVTIERDGTQVGPQPVIVLLTTDGILLLYHVVSLNLNRPSLIKPVQYVVLDQSINGTKPAVVPPKVNAFPSISSQPFGTTFNANSTASGTTGFTTPKNSIFGGGITSGFGTPTIPQFGSAAGLFTKPEVDNSKNIENDAAKLEAEKKAAEELQKKADDEAQKLAADELQRKKEEEYRKVLEEAERKKREEEKKAAEESERKRREEEARKLALEEEKRKKDAERKAQISKIKAEYYQSLETVVRNMNDYRKVIDAFHEIRMQMEANAAQNLEFDSFMAPLNKCIESVKVIGQVIANDLHRYSMITNNLEITANEIKNISREPKSEGITPEWVMELSDNLDDLEQRLFEVTEKFTFCTNTLDYVGKGMKDGRTKVAMKMVLTKDQQKILSKNSEVLIEFVKKLSTRLTNLRKQLRTIAQSEIIRKTAENLNRAGGEILEESAFLDESLNASATAANLLANDFSVLKVDDNPFAETNLGGKIIAIKKVSMFYEKNKHQGPKIVQALNLDDYLAKKKLLVEKKDEMIVVHPKVAEARRSLAENLKATKHLKQLNTSTKLENASEKKPFDLSSLLGKIEQEKNLIFASDTTITPKLNTFPNLSDGATSITGKPIIVPKSESTPQKQLITSTPIGFPVVTSTTLGFGSPVTSSTPQFASPVTTSKTPGFAPPITTSTPIVPVTTSTKPEIAAPVTTSTPIGLPVATSTKTGFAFPLITSTSEFTSPITTSTPIVPVTTSTKPEFAFPVTTSTPKFASPVTTSTPIVPVTSSTKPEIAAPVTTSTPTALPVASSTKSAITAPVTTSTTPGFSSSVTLSTTPGFGSSSVASPFASPLATAAQKPSPFAPAQIRASSTNDGDVGMEDDATAGLGFGGFGLGTVTKNGNINKNPFGDMFESKKEPAASPFGQAQPGFLQNVFAQKPATGGFGTSNAAGSTMFGGGSATKSVFGGGTSLGSSFGGGTSVFGPKTSAFGGGSQLVQGSNSAFAQQPATNTGFGQPSAFTTQPSAFGQTPSPFSQPSGASPFSQKTTPFGQGISNSPFAQNSGTSSAFGQNKSAFGGGTGFGSGGGFSSFANKSGGFGALAQQSTQQQQQSAFGGGAFGQSPNNSGQTKNAFSSWRS